MAGNGDVNVAFSTNGADQAAAEIKRFNQSIKDAELAWANATQNFSRAAQSTEKAATLFDLATAAAKKNREALEQLGATAGKSGSQVEGGSKNIDQARERSDLFAKSTDKLKGQMSDFGREAVRYGLAVAGIATAFQALKHAYEAGEAVETAHVRLRNLVGDAQQGDKAFQGLQKVSHDTSTSVVELADASENLIDTGTGVDQLTGRMSNLAKVAHITGEPLGQIADLYGRIQLRGEVSLRELFQLTSVTGGAIRQLAIDYRNELRQVEASNAVLEAGNKILAVAHEQVNLHTNAIDALGEKIGFTKEIYASWLKQPTLNTLFTVPGFGGTAVAGLSTKFIEQFRNGIKEIARETGISEAAVRQFAKEGVFGFQDLTAASIRYGDYQTKQAEQANEVVRAGLASKAAQDQLTIFQKIIDALNDTTKIQQGFVVWQGTAAGKMADINQQIERSFQKVGEQIVKHFDAAKGAVELLGGALLTIKAVEFGAFIARIAGITTAWKGVETAAKEAAAASEIASAPKPTTPTPTTPSGPGGAANALGFFPFWVLEGIQKKKEDTDYFKQKYPDLFKQGSESHSLVSPFMQRAFGNAPSLPPTGAVSGAPTGAFGAAALGPFKAPIATLDTNVGLPTPVQHSASDVAAGLAFDRANRTKANPAYRSPTDLFRRGGAEQIWGSLGSTSGISAATALDQAADTGIHAPSLTPTTTPLQERALRAGLFERDQSGKPQLTQLGQQRLGGDQTSKQLGDIHKEIVGQRQDLGKVLSASQ